MSRWIGKKIAEVRELSSLLSVGWKVVEGAMTSLLALGLNKSVVIEEEQDI